MIKVRLYEHMDYMLKGNSFRQEFIAYSTSEFTFVAEMRDEEGSDLLFRNEESAKLLKMHGIDLGENDYYSIKLNGCKKSVFNLSEDIKYALLAMFYSKQGKFISYKNCSEDIMEYLADLSFDILIAIDTYEYSVNIPWGYETEYTIINYPYQGKEIEVNVKNYSKLGRKLYESELSETMDSSAGLVLGNDGKYYNTTLWIKRALRYYWENDVENIIKYLEKREYNREYLINTTKEYDYFSFMKAIHATYATTYSQIEYLTKIEGVKDCFGRKGYTKREIKDIAKKWITDEERKKYLWYRDQLKIICHLKTCPKRVFCKSLFLIVTKHTDGKYRIHGDLSVKYQEFHEVFAHVVEKCMEDDKEVFALLVEGNKFLNKLDDIENTICGFKVMKDCIEIFEKEKALLMFGSALKEAHYLGERKKY